jgi:SLT domain-containing protein
VLQVLAMLGQPAGDLGVVLRQIQTESGGNPYAINLTDINAQMGDPSRGLLQTIMTTFLAYAGPYRSLGIYNPLANIYAGLNYAIHRYGAAWTSVLGQGHGYDLGGYLPSGLSLAYNGTGRPERVLGPGEGTQITLVIEGRGPYGQYLANEIRRLARVQGGGDVQAAFGTAG